MGDYSGNPEEPLPKLKDRKFVTIDRDNFDDVLKACKPRATFRVENKLTNDGSLLPVELNFRSMEDFNPENVAKQVEPMRRLLEVRSRLSELRSKLYGNDKLEGMLSEVMKDTDKLKQISEAGAKAEEGKAS
jgi:type VI secretion system protein ImpB